MLDNMRADIDENDFDIIIDNIDVSVLERAKSDMSKELLEIEKALLVNKERAKGKGRAVAEIENNFATIAVINEKIKAYKYAGDCGEIIAMESFGASAPAGQLFPHFGFTVENVVEKALASLKNCK
jgi:transketolase